MIPTFRSMVVATLLTLMALVGGFGLFAAFRVNHGPLARLPTSATPFALADNNASPRALGFASEPTFGSRLESSVAVTAITIESTSEPNTAEHDPDSVDVVAPRSGAVGPEGSSDRTPATTATLDPNGNDGSPLDSSGAADPQADRALPPAAVAEVEPKADGAALPTVAAAEGDPKAGNAEPPQPDTVAAPMPQTAAVEAPSDQQPKDQQPSYRASDGAASAAPATENGQVQSPPDLASPATPAPAVTAALTPDARATVQPADGRDTAREAARRRRLAAARRARHARELAAAQSADQNSFFPLANFQSKPQVDNPPAQQATGGPFVPARAPAKTRRQN